ncbi:MAG: hypothetical protein U5Q44_12685 [Dehalococcoidia bacterium]|nr:hypothetical protein [Dehalococcoidia bacterium]
MRDALAEHGLAVDDGALAAASRWAIEVYAPDTYAAITWRLSGGGPVAQDVHRRFHELFEARQSDKDLFQPRPGMRELLEELGRSGLALGIAANQAETVLASLQHHEIAAYFASTPA